MTFLPWTPVTDDKLNYFIFQNTHSSTHPHLFWRHFKANAFFPTPPQFILLIYLIKIPLNPFLLLLFLLFTGAIKIPLLTDSDLTSNSLTSVPMHAEEGSRGGWFILCGQQPICIWNGGGNRRRQSWKTGHWHQTLISTWPVKLRTVPFGVL